MKLVCRWCGKIEERDMRLKINKDSVKRYGFRSFCDNFSKTSYLKAVNPHNLNMSLKRNHALVASKQPSSRR